MRASEANEAHGRLTDAADELGEDMEGTAITTRPATALVGAADILTQVKVVQEVMRSVMKPDIHYGTIPGTPKPSLWKPGAEVLCAVFRIADSYRIEDLSNDDCVRYRVVCVGTHQTTGIVMGEGAGECSSNEKKYKWIKAYPREWDSTPENRRRKTYGWDKKKQAEYEILQVRVDPADVANTVLKMANKRAKIAMVLNVTAASDIFSQDLEDLDERLQSMMADERAPESASMPQEEIDKLKTLLSGAKTREELTERIKTAMAATTAAGDKDAHTAIRAYAADLAKNMAAPKAEEPAIEGEARSEEDVPQ